MRISDLYPFISELPISRSVSIDHIPIDRVLIFPNLMPLIQEVINQFPSVKNFFHFKSVNVYVPNITCIGDAVSTYVQLLKSNKGDWLSQEVDPFFLSVLEEDDGTLVFHKLGGSYRIKVSPEFVPYYKVLVGDLDPSPYLLSKNVELSEFIDSSISSMKEGLFDDAETSQIKQSAPIINWGSFEEVASYLTSTPVPGKTDEIVPLLVGHTGVSKSAIIKGVVAKASTPHGLRLVDLRVSFMDKLDIEGYAKYLKTPTGTEFEMGPMKDLIKVTDAFLATVRSFLADPQFKDKLQDHPGDRATLQELAKTPVLVFEEVNRCPKDIRQVLTTLLNQKKILQYSFNEARVIATANMPTGSKETVQRLNDAKYYIANGFDDVAYRNRFVFVDVDPRTDPSVRASWYNWAYGPPYPRDLVVVSKSYKESKNYKDVKDYDASLVGHLVVVDEPITNGPQSDESMMYLVHDCGVLDAKLLEVLRNNDAKEAFITENMIAVKSFTISKSDLKSFNINSDSTDIDNDPSFQKLDASNIHPIALQFIAQNPNDLYNMDTVEKNAGEFTSIGDSAVEVDVRNIPVTSFRSWEFVSKILRNREKSNDKNLFQESFQGMMDKGSSDRFIKFATSKEIGYKTKKVTDKYTELLEDALACGVPVLMQGPSSVGKTSRVKNYVSKLNSLSKSPEDATVISMHPEVGDNGVEYFNVDLSTKDRTAARGFTHPVDAVQGIFTKDKLDNSPVIQMFNQYYKGNIYKAGDMVTYIGSLDEKAKGNVYKVNELLPDGQVSIEEILGTGALAKPSGKVITAQSSEVMIDRGLPSTTTEGAFSADLIKSVERAKALKKPIVIFVDEINRVQSDTLMTIILEAISDNKIMGVDCTGCDVKVVAACNMGKQFKDTKPLDPATVARFMNVVKTDVDITDFQAFMKMAKEGVAKKEMHPVVISAIEHLGSTDKQRFDKFSKIFYTPSTAEPTDEYSSTRALTFLSSFLYGDKLTIPIKGKKIATDPVIFQNAVLSNTSATSLTEKWVARNYKDEIKMAGSTSIFVPQLIKETQSDFYDKLVTMSEADKKKVISNMFVYYSKVEEFVTESRTKVVMTNIHIDPAKTPEMLDFLIAFNKAADESVIWDDLVDSKLVYEFLIARYATDALKSPADEFLTLFKKAAKEFHNYLDLDYANWLAAFIMVLKGTSSLTEFGPVVLKLYQDADANKLLSSILTPEAFKVVTAAYK